MPEKETDQRVLHRLSTVEPTPEAMFDALDHAQLDEFEADITPIDVAGSPGLLVTGADTKLAEGPELLATTTGAHIAPCEEVRFTGLLMLAVDDITYAYSMGTGFRLIPEKRKDKRFGLSFAIRSLAPDQVKDITRMVPGTRGRVDATTIPCAAPVWRFGLRRHKEIVRRIGGRLHDVELTSTRGGRQPVGVQGSTGLKVRLGVRADALVSDIQKIAAICAKPPDPALEFVDNVCPVGDPVLRDRLERRLDALLGSPDGVPENLGLAVPTSCLERYGEARSFTIKVGAATLERPELYLADIVGRARIQRAGRRPAALRNGYVAMQAGADDPLDRTRAIDWIDVDVDVDTRRYFLMDGDWYKVGEQYLRSVRRQITELLGSDCSVSLPEWYVGTETDKGWIEERYNAEVHGKLGLINLNKALVPTRLHRGNGVEICDLLGPGNELIHVKHAEKSGPLSHLFYQGVVSVETLRHDLDAKARFAETVRRKGSGRTLPDDYLPRKVIFAILLKKGASLTADTLFPFSQISLLDAVHTFHFEGIDVEVVGIAPAVADRAA